MGITPEFMRAVNGKEITKVRVMLKDSIFLDPSFEDYNDMLKYAESKSINVWMDSSERVEEFPIEQWDKELLNKELSALMFEFTKARMEYCKKMVRKLYGNNSNKKRPTSNSNSCRKKRSPEFKKIKNSIININKVLDSVRTRSDRSNKGEEWKNSEIDEIFKAASIILTTCEELKKGRK